MRNSYVIDNLLSVWGCLDSQVFFTSWQKVPATISKCTYTNIWLAHTDVFSPFPAKLVSSSSIPSKWMCNLTAPFFEEFHNALACTVKLLLRNSGPLEAIFSSPKRGDTLDKLLEKVEENGLNFSIIENYDSEVWKCHQGFMAGDDSWPSYEKHHCYPLFVRIHYKLSRPFIFRSYPVFLGKGYSSIYLCHAAITM